MSQQIKFFKMNKIDIKNTNITITITDTVATSKGDDLKDYIRNRNNRSAWITTGSTDAANTQLDIDMGDAESFDHLILAKHNWGSFTIQYWDGFAYQDFSTPINESTNTDENSIFIFNEVSSTKIRIIITGTQTADADKELYQLIVGELIGQLNAWPEVKKPRHVSGKRRSKMLSGKMNIVEPVGRFSVDLKVKYWKNAADLAVVEKLYFDRLPVLVWLGGGDETQFTYAARGYRVEDLYLMRTVNDYSPQWFKNVYNTGLDLTIKLDEVID